MKSSKYVVNIFTLIFMLSGFSGLIYESIWSHYIKLMLGHASYAQVLVLAIFMGGMAIGSMAASRWSVNLKNLILAYGVVELLVGLFGILFHPLFVGTQSTLFQSILPALGSAELVNGVKWGVAALLILPQSILLGATFPLLTVGILRKYPDQPGGTIAKLYFANSFGAAVGILCNSFLILPAVGLPGAAMFAGILNILLAIVVYRLVKKDSFPFQAPTEKYSGVSHYYLLSIAALTGVASFLYEVGWIRMLTMVLGGSTHSFEIMLAAFILGLAIGGLLIRKYIDRFKEPVIALALIQLSMGLLAVLTVPLYGKTFELMSFVVNALRPTEEGHILYLVCSLLMSMLVMLPATICAGTTLPLISYILVKSKAGDTAIGRVYAWNTVGAIIGVVLASQVVMPLLGLKWVIVFGGVIDLALGAFLIWKFRQNLLAKKSVYSFAAAAILIAGFYSLYSLDVRNMASGVYRYGVSQIDKGSEILFHKDGKTSTVAIKKTGDHLALINNGKPDAAIFMKGDKDSAQHSADEPTMIMVGALPYIYKPESKLVANIGMGSGLTAHTALLNKDVLRVDTIEIEEEVYNAGRFFDYKVERMYTDKRSNVVIEDAKTYFASANEQYDVIISEPPNPWVSGVAGLFTTEFYREIKRYIKPDGALVQWMHVYELTPELLATIYKALAENFSHIHVYQISRSDLAFVVSNEKLTQNLAGAFKHPELKELLHKINIKSEVDLAYRQLATKPVLDAVFGSYTVPVNSDYFPVLDYGAGKARFMRQSAGNIMSLRSANLLKDLLNEDKLPASPVNNAHWVSGLAEHNLRESFDVRLADKLQGSSDILLNDVAGSYAYWVAEFLSDCNRDMGYYQTDVSNQIIVATEWLFKSYSRKKMLELINLIQSCNPNRLSELAVNWLDIHSAWIQGDYQKVKRVSKSLVESNDIDSPYLVRMMSFYAASRIALGETGALGVNLSKEGYELMLKDVELRGLLYLLSNP